MGREGVEMLNESNALTFSSKGYLEIPVDFAAGQSQL
jgi:hypothetical protein